MKGFTRFRRLALAAIILGGIILSVDRHWLGTSWSFRSMMFPIGAAAIRGLTHPITKLGLAKWPSAFAATLIAYTVSSLVIACTARIQSAGWPSAYHRAGLLWFACTGICNNVGVLALYGALARGPVMLVSPLVATYPLVTLGFAALVFRSAKTSKAVYAGVATTVAGVTLLIAH